MSKTTLSALLSGVLVLILTAFLTPLGDKIVNAAWPDKPATSPSPSVRPPTATTVPTSVGCRPGGPPIAVALTYDFTGSVWWATSRKLTQQTIDQLEADSDPFTTLATYEPVASEFGAGTLLKLTVTGCGPSPVVITNMYASVVQRADPLSGSVVWRPPQGNLDVTPIAFDLDAPPRSAALDYDFTLRKLRGPYFSLHQTQVNAGETVPFEVMGLTKRSYLEWTIAISALVGGHPWEFGISLPEGRPIRSTAVAASYQSALVLSNLHARYEPMDPARIVEELRDSK